jgi:hypothetical protein
MKTTILDDLDLPEERRAALSREALRRGLPVAELIRQMVLEKSNQLVSAAEATHQRQAA